MRKTLSFLLERDQEALDDIRTHWRRECTKAYTNAVDFTTRDEIVDQRAANVVFSTGNYTFG